LSTRTVKVKKKLLEGSSIEHPTILDETLFGENEIEFTLAHVPTNGEYRFDVNVKLTNGLNHIVGIKIQKRKVESNHKVEISNKPNNFMQVNLADIVKVDKKSKEWRKIMNDELKKGMKRMLNDEELMKKADEKKIKLEIFDAS